ncbi:MAG: hypothetical protein WDN46_04330 [Methylocella sp.]
MNENKWVFNDRHMGNAVNWNPDKHSSILLLGNSIVLGGNTYDQADKLGPQLQAVLGAEYAVWSAAAGGWTDVNEMNYLDENKDVLQNSDVVIVEYMAGGLSEIAKWPGYYVFPDHNPPILTSYIFTKHVLPRLIGNIVLNESGSLPPTGEADPRQLKRFASVISNMAATREVLIFLYPTKTLFLNKPAWTAATADIIEMCRSLAIQCIDVAADDRWTADLYASDATHPKAKGNKVLASILASGVEAVGTVAAANSQVGAR